MAAGRVKEVISRGHGPAAVARVRTLPISLRAIETPLGSILGGASEAGICLCEFSDRGGEEDIIARLGKRHGPGMRVLGLRDREATRDGPPQTTHLDALERQLGEYFAGARREFDLPLDLAGTAWQKGVWSALMEIPYGATASYGELASRLGKPGGSRAVGRANGQNCVAIVVPCHRVIQADGGLGGYGGTLQRKRWLLDLETGVRQLPL